MNEGFFLSPAEEDATEQGARMHHVPAPKTAVVAVVVVAAGQLYNYQMAIILP